MDDRPEKAGGMDLSDLLSSMAPSGDDDDDGADVVTARREWKWRRKVTALSYSSVISG